MCLISSTEVMLKVYRDVGFLTYLNMFCVVAKIRDCPGAHCCKVFAIIDKIAPVCNWIVFQHWLLVAISCQETLAVP